MLVTSIGSLPFVDIDRAIDLIFRSCPEVPFWPQLPNRSFLEDMYVQALEGIPAVKVDEATRAVWVDTAATEGIEAFYENVSEGRTDAFPISRQAAPGFHRFLERLPEVRERVRFVKTQLTGPFTLGIGLKDELGKPIIYNSAYFDIIKKALHMKARWMIQAMNKAAPDKEVVLFFDEPAMTSFGSAFVPISKEEAVSLFDEVVDGLDARVGIHCCGNTDWSVLLQTKADIINYDAFEFMDTLFYFRSELKTFLARGGRVVPGIVPSSGEALGRVSPIDLAERWKTFQGLIAEFEEGIDEDPLVTTSCGLVTTACGLGSLAEAEATKALVLLSLLPGAAGQ